MSPLPPYLSKFGFRFGRASVHTARTMMLAELTTLLTVVDAPDAGRSDYTEAIVEQNCLGKPSSNARSLTAEHLVDLYTLDPAVPLFRTMHYFWRRDPAAQPLLALLCTYTRDTLLRTTTPFIMKLPLGTTLPRSTMEHYLAAQEPDRFSAATLKSVAQNINATWTQSGHLSGRAVKVRTPAAPTAGSVAFALLLGYWAGLRGDFLFTSPFIELQDCSFDTALALAAEGSRRGWIVLNRVATVTEVLFPGLIPPKEMGWLHEHE